MKKVDALIDRQADGSGTGPASVGEQIQARCS
jgi:hypothetical protein